MMKLFVFALTSLAALAANAYVPTSRTIVGRLVRNDGKGIYAIEQDVNFRTVGEGVTLRERWVVENGETMRLTVITPTANAPQPVRIDFLYKDGRRMAPDFKGLAGLGDDQFICTAPGERNDVVSRVFVPGAGVDEDSVTGSAHAALTPFWAARLGRVSFTAHQASRRGGDLTCRLDDGQAWLGGHCVTIVEGSFYLEG